MLAGLLLAMAGRFNETAISLNVARDVASFVECQARDGRRARRMGK